MGFRALPLSLVVLIAPGTAQQFRPQMKLTLPGADARALGASVALAGDTLVVGAPSEDPRGAVHVFTRSAGLWQPSASIVCPPFSYEELFGARVALSGDTLLVMALGDIYHSYANRVHAYHRGASGWVEEASWTLPSADDLALEGDLALIGDSRADSSVSWSGRVLIGARSGSSWSTTVLLPPVPHAFGRFGSAVALQGTTIAVGETLRDPQEHETGIVHVFDASGGTWIETATLASGGLDDGFGAERIALSGDTLAIGAPNFAPLYDRDWGAVHVFVRTGTSWTRQAVLLASDPDTGDLFGRDLALDGDTLLATAEYDDNANGVSAGSTRVFERQNGVWSEAAPLVSLEPIPVLQFGRCAALSADTAVVGSPRWEQLAQPSGAAYVFARVAPPTPSIDAVTPDPLEALYPGTDKTVALHGSGFDHAVALYLDGLRVDPARYAIVAADELQLDMPQLPQLGAFSFGLYDGAGMAFLPARVVAPAQPRMEIGVGEFLESVVHRGAFESVTTRLAGPVGSVQYLLASFSNLPSSNAYVSLGLGSQFTQLAHVVRVVIPGTGLLEFQSDSTQFPDPGSGALDLYAQMMMFARPAPFRVSNLQAIQVLP